VGVDLRIVPAARGSFQRRQRLLRASLAQQGAAQNVQRAEIPRVLL
jgi:hypothetical protein